MILQVDKEHLKDYDIIFEGQYAACSQVINFLSGQGSRPVLVENPNLLSRGAGFRMFHVAVHKDDTIRARDLMQNFQMESEKVVSVISRQLSAQFILSMILTIPFVVIFLVTGIFLELFTLLVLIWAGIFLLIANSHRIFKKSEKNISSNSSPDKLQ